MVTSIWDGITTSIHCWFPVEKRVGLFSGANENQWDKVFSIIKTYPEIINIIEPNETSYNSIIHCAAQKGVSKDVVMRLIEAGASRNIRNTGFQKAIDIAKQNYRQHLYEILEPVNKYDVNTDEILAIERQFHKVIMACDSGIVGELVTEQFMRLPQLEPLLELENPKAWFQIPMYFGGINYWLMVNDNPIRLLSKTSSRMGYANDYELWEVTAEKFRLLDKNDLEKQFLLRIELDLL